MVYRIENHEAPNLFTLQLALKDVHDKLQEMAPIEQNLIPIRRRLYRFQLHEDRAAQQLGCFSYGSSRRLCSLRDYDLYIHQGYAKFQGKHQLWNLYMHHIVDSENTLSPGTKSPDSRDTDVDDLKTNASWDEDECVSQSERQTTLLRSVSREFFDADGLRPDRVLKRETRLQEILKEGLFYDVFCGRWYPWLASLCHEEYREDKESAESIEMVNLSTKESPTPPSTTQGNS